MLASAARAARAGQVSNTHRALATVAVGMSGGVDSSVAALLLKQQGHDVIGMHMTNWDAAEEGAELQQCIEQDAKDARRVCEQIGIGFHETSFVREYWSAVFEPLLAGYHSGGTPNPDVMCNRHIKFDRFVEHSLGLGADFVATGHYARLDRSGGVTDRDGVKTVQLLKAADETKDQTYFLAAVRQEGLRSALFPLGDYLKTEVRTLAADAGLHTASKRESMGICFIGKRRFSTFLESYLPQVPGDFVCIDSGEVIGAHKGYALYTPGQRARLQRVPKSRVGTNDVGRWYVVDKDVDANRVYLCEGATHPALATRTFVTTAPSWISGVPPPELSGASDGFSDGTVAYGGRLSCSMRIRHPGVIWDGVRVEWISCADHAAGQASSGAGRLQASFEQAVHDVAELQAVAFYDGDVCLGGAQIHTRGPSLLDEVKGLERVGWNGGQGGRIDAFVGG